MLTFIDLVGPRTGGAITVAKNILFQIAQLRPEWRFKVCLLPEAQSSFQAINRENIEFVPVRNVRNKLARIVWQQWSLPRLARRHGASVIFSLVNIGSSYSRIPTVVYYHQALLFSPIGALHKVGVQQALSKYWKRLFVLSGFRRAAKVIVQTKVMREKIISETNIQTDKIASIHTGCPMNEELSARQETEVDNIVEVVESICSPVIIYLSHPAFYKNFSIIFKAAERMKERTIPGSFVLTLDKSRYCDRQYNRLVSQCLCEIKTRNVEDRVHCIGSIPSGGVFKVLQSCQALVFPSLVESFPQPLLEAMSIGLPILAADRPYAREIVGQAGLFFDPLDDGTELANSIKELFTSSALEKFGSSSSARAQEYSSQKAAELISGILLASASNAHSGHLVRFESMA